jgi:hypothetical protein
MNFTFFILCITITNLLGHTLQLPFFILEYFIPFVFPPLSWSVFSFMHVVTVNDQMFYNFFLRLYCSSLVLTL